MRYPKPAFEPFFTWLNRPRIMYAPGLRSELAYELSELGGARAAIFTDKGLMNAGVTAKVLDELADSHIDAVGVFDDIVQDARIDIINSGAAFYRECGADCMVVVGGGSVMDTAKAVNILVGHDAEDFQPLAEQAALWEDAEELPPHIAFPTTAGTGCEVTNAMVVLDPEARAKLTVTHPYCNSDLAMLDPELTIDLPPKITAFTGMDALTHAVEGITSTGAEPIADALGLHAIRLICAYLPTAVRNPEDLEARGNMLIASTLAGMCFCNTMTGAVHATAHALGGKYSIPHGMANAIMLPIVMEFNADQVPERFMMIADAMGLDLTGLSTDEAARSAARAVRDLKAEIGLNETLAEYGVPQDRERLVELAEAAGGDSQIGYNPKYCEEDDIVKLYLKAF